MTVDEAIKLIDELRGRFNAPYSTVDKDAIAKLYETVLGKTFRPTTCQQCYHDAVIEIYLYLRKNHSFMERGKIRMRAGFIIHCPTFHGGKIFTNDNLTDEIAQEYIEKFPTQARYFDGVENTPKKQQKPVRTKKTKK